MESVIIDKFIPGGQGIGTLKSGKKAFIWGALPGETVEFQITKNKSSFCEGVATKIITKSKRRSNLRDPCYLATSPWQILDYPYELEQKSLLVQECFRQMGVEVQMNDLSEHGRGRPAVAGDQPSSPHLSSQIVKAPQSHSSELQSAITDGKDYFYRNKMEYSLYWNNDTTKIELAFHTRGTHRKIPITQSSIERPEIFTEAQRIVDQLNAEHKSARDYQSLLVRCNQQGTVSAALFENHKPRPKMIPLTDTLFGHKYSYSPNGFFQINLPVYELALQVIKQHIKTPKVLDLYAGVGTIGLSVARNHHLTLVETDKSAYSELVKNCESVDFGQSARSYVTSEEAVEEGRADLATNCLGIQMTSFKEPLPSVTTEAGRTWRSRVTTRRPQVRAPKSLSSESHIKPIFAKSEEVLDFITPDSTIILDPPRAGCNPKLIEKLAQVKPPTIIYLSCNPITQARDIKPLLQHYQIKLCQPFNFFPRTPHIENLIILTPR